MQLERWKNRIAVVWMLTFAAVVYGVRPDSIVGWTLFVVVGLVPPLVLLRLWSPSDQSTSESIQEALRR